MEKRALVLINRSAGTGKAGNNTLAIATGLAERGYEPIVYPIIPGTGLTSETIIGRYDGKVEKIVCSGGDGTLNHVVGAVMDMKEKPEIAYIPAGSTNDFAKGLGIPSVHSAAIEVALDGYPFSYDVGRMNDRYFNYVAAFGAFSKVSYATDQDLKNILGYAAYVISAISELPQSLGYNTHMKIEVDGEITEDDYVFGAVCNSGSIGGMNIFGKTDVKLDDGEMELLLIHAPKNIMEFNEILGALATNIESSKLITVKQVKNVKFKSETFCEWTIDGEFGGASKETDISVINKAITIKVKHKK
ncbi:MAG: YegS/Rv2252/BmrU family lipid kinase [Butyrivibrio sp.]|nr:YegS/Rv2252/BmrU family lipid kinase [Butyrivibrio sp.]